MMKIKYYLLFFSLLCCSWKLQAQSHLSIDELQPPKNFDNIHVERIDGDSLSTSFVIWIKKEVAPHYHEEHSEQVLILSGSGKMKLGEKELEVKKNDLIFIPAKTPHSVQVTSKKPLKVLSIQSPEFKGKDRVLLND